jgi:hypothetical protein
MKYTKGSTVSGKEAAGLTKRVLAIDHDTRSIAAPDTARSLEESNKGVNSAHSLLKLTEGLDPSVKAVSVSPGTRGPHFQEGGR